MIWFVLFVAVVLVVLTTAAVLGRVDGSLGDATSTMSHEPLPAGPLRPADLDDLRFDTALRGYRMTEVDAVIDRLRRELQDLDADVARLRRAPAAADAPDHAESPETAGQSPDAFEQSPGTSGPAPVGPTAPDPT